MKKEYMKPAMQETIIEQLQIICHSVYGTNGNTNIEYGGEGGEEEPRAPGYFGWTDE